MMACVGLAGPDGVWSSEDRIGNPFDDDDSKSRFAGRTMIDRWFSVIKLPLSWGQFHRLPRNPAYKYEYLGKAAWLSPRPKIFSARLALGPPADAPPSEIEVHREATRLRRLEDRDWPRLSRLFAGSFHRVQPFASLGDRRRLEAARACLKATRDGRDGPIIRPACHVAVDGDAGQPVGAILVTLVPPVDLEDFWSLRWKTPPPPDCVERRLGHAHLTWIFVHHGFVGHGIGSALLAHASNHLIELGYTELISSFILGNESSMLWHWRNGFELLPYCGSKRQFRERMRAQETHSDGEVQPREGSGSHPTH
jgi:GNAT superfamily N-acetyltransferase